MVEYENLNEIIAKTLIGKKLLYINSKSYKDSTIVSIDNIHCDSTERYGGYAQITITIEQPFKSTKRKRSVSFLNDDRVVVE